MLVAAGRKPNIENLNLDVADVQWNDKGIITDKSLRTTNKRIYAIGDVAGREAFTHAAGHMGGQVAQHILFGKPFDINKSLIPHCIYTSLEVASVGMKTNSCLKADFSDNDRSICEGNPQGFIKIYHEKGIIKGAVIVGKGAGEMISLYTLALQKGMKLVDIAQIIMPYPTLSEVGKRAVGEYFRSFSSNKWLRLFVKWKLKLT
jgi:pyruvate/2-oxoglutarate dehydrogenase complex dihydrolipoamide dehydrogenase (E3) component